MPLAEPARISVAMCTRDGEGFVAEQLTSILRQTRLPDELVLFDDRSTDDTVAIARRVLHDAPFTTRVCSNPHPLGVTANFSAAIAAASGDVIVLADQDDVWHPDKLTRLGSAFERSADVLAVFSDAHLIDGAGQPLPGTLWSRVGVSRGARRRLESGAVLEQLCRWKVVTGSTLAFRTGIVPLLLPMPPSTLHDSWIAVVAALLGRVVAVPEPLVSYRIHGANTVGVPSRDPQALVASHAGDAGVRDDELAMFELAATRTDGVADPRRLDLVARKVSFLEQRAGLDRRAVRRVWPVAAGLVQGRYHALGHGWRSAAHDLLIGR
ncbi:MAG: hypothetical protein QOH64_46 [Acidimicrobiaceae bacterium]